MLSDEPALGAWIAATVLAPLGCLGRTEHAVPDRPEADVAILALGTALAREELAPPSPAAGASPWWRCWGAPSRTGRASSRPA